MKLTRPGKIAPCEKLLRVVFCYVPPGEESEVYKRFEELPDSLCLVGLSECSLIGLVPCSLPILQTRVPQFFASVLKGSQEILCFPWESLYPSLNEWAAVYPAKLISLLKINESLTRSLGLKVEEAFARWIAANRGSAFREASCSVMTYGTLNWTEVALLWSGAGFKQIMDQMVGIRQLTALDLSDYLEGIEVPSRIGNERLFVFTRSLPCVNMDPTSSTIYQGPHLERADDGISARLVVTCASGAEIHVARQIQHAFGDELTVMVSFGHDDLSVSSRRGLSLAKLGELLGFVRSLGSELVLSTRAEISTHIASVSVNQEFNSTSDQEAGETEVPPYQLELLGELSAFESCIKNPWLEFAPQLSQMLSKYRAVAGVQEWKGQVDDLDGFLHNVFVHVSEVLYEQSPLPEINHEVRSAYDLFETGYRIFQHAFDQRTGGSQIGMSAGSQSSVGLQSGGIQRILDAATAVPIEMMSLFSFGDERRFLWDGCVVLGYENETLRLPYGALNIPAGNLLKPAEWWTLCHEVGHEFLHTLNLLERAEIKSVTDEVVRGKSEAPLLRGGHFLSTAGQVEELVSELIADVFCFQFGFHREWELFTPALWNLLQNHLEGRTSLHQAAKYLIRYTFVYFYHLETEGAIRQNEDIAEVIARSQVLRERLYSLGEEEAHYAEGEGPVVHNIRHRAFSRYSSLAELIRKHLVPLIIKAAPRVTPLIENVSPEVVAHWYRVLEPLRSTLIRIFRLSAPTIRSGSHSLWRARRSLRRGKLYLEADVRPVDIVLALQREKLRREHGDRQALSDKEWARVVLNGILSLWHAGKTMPYG